MSELRFLNLELLGKTDDILRLRLTLSDEKVAGSRRAEWRKDLLSKFFGLPRETIQGCNSAFIEGDRLIEERAIELRLFIRTMCSILWCGVGFQTSENFWVHYEGNGNVEIHQDEFGLLLSLASSGISLDMEE